VANQVSNSRVSARYAEGLYKVTSEHNCIDKIESNLEGLLSTLEKTPKLLWFFKNPLIVPQNKRDLVVFVLAPILRLNQYTISLLFLLIDKNRAGYISAISKIYLELVQKRKVIKTVRVFSYLKLTAYQERLLTTNLYLKTEANKTKLEMYVDQSLLGGLIVEMDSKRIDMTLKGAIRRLSNYFGIPFIAPKLK
jgi:F-type H+-transporting ATPase subunit delta